MQFQSQYETLQTSALISSATGTLIAAKSRRSAGVSKVLVPQVIVLDAIMAAGIGSAGFVTLSASGTVLARLGFPVSDSSAHNPTHLKGGVGDAIAMFASGSAGAITVNFHLE